MSDKMTDAWVKELYWEEARSSCGISSRASSCRNLRGLVWAIFMRSISGSTRGDRPTKELASLLTKKREMEDLHRTLKLGR